MKRKEDKKRLWILIASLAAIIALIFIYESYKLNQKPTSPTLLGVAGVYSEEYTDLVKDQNIHVFENNEKKFHLENQDFDKLVEISGSVSSFIYLSNIDKDINLESPNNKVVNLSQNPIEITNINENYSTEGNHDQFITTMNIKVNNMATRPLNLYEIYDNGDGAYYAILRYVVKQIDQTHAFNFIGLIDGTQKPTTHFIITNIE